MKTSKTGNLSGCLDCWCPERSNGRYCQSSIIRLLTSSKHALSFFLDNYEWQITLVTIAPEHVLRIVCGESEMSVTFYIVHWALGGNIWTRVQENIFQHWLVLYCNGGRGSCIISCLDIGVIQEKISRFWFEIFNAGNLLDYLSIILSHA